MKPADAYLLLYNAVQVFGWGTILVKTLLGLSNGLSIEKIYGSVETELQIFQTAAVLEIIHIAMGLVRSPLGTTITQVFSRVTVVWLILFKVASSRSSFGVPMLLVAWSITEVVRYSFYALNLIKSVPWGLVWMRYTFFIVLYPMGASGEVITMLSALNEIGRKKHFTGIKLLITTTVEMPNAMNFGFSFYYFVIVLCLIYIPGFPQLYGYMFSQRMKVLSVDKAKKAS